VWGPYDPGCGLGATVDTDWGSNQGDDTWATFQVCNAFGGGCENIHSTHDVCVYDSCYYFDEATPGSADCIQIVWVYENPYWAEVWCPGQ
jgi:hypothetical protein